jgi:hypothetical protein
MFPPRNLLRAPNAFSELAIAAKKQQNHLHGIMQEHTAHLRRSRQRQQIIGHRRESRLLPARPLRLLCSDRAGSQSAPTTPTDKAHEGPHHRRFRRCVPLPCRGRGHQRQTPLRAFSILKFATGRATFPTCQSLIPPSLPKSAAAKRPLKPLSYRKPKKGLDKK